MPKPRKVVRGEFVWATYYGGREVHAAHLVVPREETDWTGVIPNRPGTAGSNLISPHEVDDDDLVEVKWVCTNCFEYVPKSDIQWPDDDDGDDDENDNEEQGRGRRRHSSRSKRRRGSLVVKKEKEEEDKEAEKKEDENEDSKPTAAKRKASTTPTKKTTTAETKSPERRSNNVKEHNQEEEDSKPAAAKKIISTTTAINTKKKPASGVVKKSNNVKRKKKKQAPPSLLPSVATTSNKEGKKTAKSVTAAKSSSSSDDTFEEELSGKFKPYKGMRISKTFEDGITYKGTVDTDLPQQVIDAETGLTSMEWNIVFDDGDREDMTFQQIYFAHKVFLKDATDEEEKKSTNKAAKTTTAAVAAASKKKKSPPKPPAKSTAGKKRKSPPGRGRVTKRKPSGATTVKKRKSIASSQPPSKNEDAEQASTKVEMAMEEDEKKEDAAPTSAASTSDYTNEPQRISVVTNSSTGPAQIGHPFARRQPPTKVSTTKGRVSGDHGDKKMATQKQRPSVAAVAKSITSKPSSSVGSDDDDDDDNDESSSSSIEGYRDNTPKVLTIAEQLEELEKLKDTLPSKEYTKRQKSLRALKKLAGHGNAGRLGLYSKSKSEIKYNGLKSQTYTDSDNENHDDDGNKISRTRRRSSAGNNRNGEKTTRDRRSRSSFNNAAVAASAPSPAVIGESTEVLTAAASNRRKEKEEDCEAEATSESGVYVEGGIDTTERQDEKENEFTSEKVVRPSPTTFLIEPSREEEPGAATGNNDIIVERGTEQRGQQQSLEEDESLDVLVDNASPTTTLTEPTIVDASSKPTNEAKEVTPSTSDRMGVVMEEAAKMAAVAVLPANDDDNTQEQPSQSHEELAETGISPQDADTPMLREKAPAAVAVAPTGDEVNEEDDEQEQPLSFPETPPGDKHFPTHTEPLASPVSTPAADDCNSDSDATVEILTPPGQAMVDRNVDTIQVVAAKPAEDEDATEQSVESQTELSLEDHVGKVDATDASAAKDDGAAKQSVQPKPLSGREEDATTSSDQNQDASTTALDGDKDKGLINHPVTGSPDRSTSPSKGSEAKKESTQDEASPTTEPQDADDAIPCTPVVPGTDENIVEKQLPEAVVTTPVAASAIKDDEVKGLSSSKMPPVTEALHSVAIPALVAPAQGETHAAKPHEKSTLKDQALHADTVDDTKWRDFDGMYQELLRFRCHFGHCRVPRNYQPDDEKVEIQAGEKEVTASSPFRSVASALGEWCHKQRSFYMKEPLNPTEQYKLRKSLLADIMFEFEITQEVRARESWEKSFTLLKLYQQQKGDCDVPDNHETLGNWVRQTRRGELDADNPLPSDLRQRLDKIGFRFLTPKNQSAEAQASPTRQKEESSIRNTDFTANSASTATTVLVAENGSVNNRSTKEPVSPKPSRDEVAQTLDALQALGQKDGEGEMRTQPQTETLTTSVSTESDALETDSHDEDGGQHSDALTLDEATHSVRAMQIASTAKDGTALDERAPLRDPPVEPAAADIAFEPKKFNLPVTCAERDTQIHDAIPVEATEPHIPSTKEGFMPATNDRMAEFSALNKRNVSESKPQTEFATEHAPSQESSAALWKDEDSPAAGPPTTEMEQSPIMEPASSQVTHEASPALPNDEVEPAAGPPTTETEQPPEVAPPVKKTSGNRQAFGEFVWVWIGKTLHPARLVLPRVHNPTCSENPSSSDKEPEVEVQWTSSGRFGTAPVSSIRYEDEDEGRLRRDRREPGRITEAPKVETTAHSHSAAQKRKLASISATHASNSGTRKTKTMYTENKTSTEYGSLDNSGDLLERLPVEKICLVSGKVVETFSTVTEARNSISTTQYKRTFLLVLQGRYNGNSHVYKGFFWRFKGSNHAPACIVSSPSIGPKAVEIPKEVSGNQERLSDRESPTVHAGSGNDLPDGVAADGIESTSSEGGQEHKVESVLLATDRMTTTGLYFSSLDQVRICRFSKSDARRCGRSRQSIGFRGLECIHCSDGRFFFGNTTSFGANFKRIPSHLLKCPQCPQSIKESIRRQEDLHLGQSSGLPGGWKKTFLQRIWRRIHDDYEGDEEDQDEYLSSSSEEGDRECVCGMIHSRPDSPSTRDRDHVFLIQCDSCQLWFQVSENCVGFDRIHASRLQKWDCWDCTPLRELARARATLGSRDLGRTLGQAPGETSSETTAAGKKRALDAEALLTNDSIPKRKRGRPRKHLLLKRGPLFNRSKHVIEAGNSIGSNDVLCGRGGSTNSNAGNIAFRFLVSKFRNEYLRASKQEKADIAEKLVERIHENGGRFLKKLDSDNYWVEVSAERATEKTKQALRESLDVKHKAYIQEKMSFYDSDAEGGKPDARTSRKGVTKIASTAGTNDGRTPEGKHFVGRPRKRDLEEAIEAKTLNYSANQIEQMPVEKLSLETGNVLCTFPTVTQARKSVSSAQHAAPFIYMLQGQIRTNSRTPNVYKGFFWRFQGSSRIPEGMSPTSTKSIARCGRQTAETTAIVALSPLAQHGDSTPEEVARQRLIELNRERKRDQIRRRKEVRLQEQSRRQEQLEESRIRKEKSQTEEVAKIAKRGKNPTKIDIPDKCRDSLNMVDRVARRTVSKFMEPVDQALLSLGFSIDKRHGKKFYYPNNIPKNHGLNTVKKLVEFLKSDQKWKNHAVIKNVLSTFEAAIEEEMRRQGECQAEDLRRPEVLQRHSEQTKERQKAASDGNDGSTSRMPTSRVKIVVPPGSLGLRLSVNKIVVSILPHCKFADKIFMGDEIVGINDKNVEGWTLPDVLRYNAEIARTERIWIFSRSLKPTSPSRVPERVILPSEIQEKTSHEADMQEKTIYANRDNNDIQAFQYEFEAPLKLAGTPQETAVGMHVTTLRLAESRRDTPSGQRRKKPAAKSLIKRIRKDSKPGVQQFVGTARKRPKKKAKYLR